jgi:hypothetical protein
MGAHFVVISAVEMGFVCICRAKFMSNRDEIVLRESGTYGKIEAMSADTLKAKPEPFVPRASIEFVSEAFLTARYGE